MRGIVETVAPISGINRDTLLRLRTGQLVTRRLIVGGKRNERCHHTHDRRRMDLHVRRFGGQIGGIIRNV